VIGVDTLTVRKLTQNVGAEITGVDADRILSDASVSGLIVGALEEYGVLVFPALGLDPETQIAVAGQLGEVDSSQGQEVAGVMVVSLDGSKTPNPDYFLGTFDWHIDGCTLPAGRNPQMGTILTAVAIADEGGQTEFASTYGAYDALTEDEKQRFGALRIRHTMSAALERCMTTEPTREQKAAWARSGAREHPLVWNHRSGRHSLVIGGTAEQVVGMDRPAGQLLLEELLERSTTPDRIYRHEWSVGDTVIWDNRGVLHRVERYAADSPREMIRTTLVGDEPIQ
jgi:alpha-ketoglutarate-dependent taurine dioxygenase